MRKAGKIMIAGAATAAATVLAACSPSLEEPTDQSPEEQAEHTPAPVSVTESGAASEENGEGRGGSTGGGAAECAATDITVATGGAEPQVQIPRDCAAPQEVVTHDVEPGSGAEVSPQSTVQVDYTVVGWADGSVADSGTASVNLASPTGEIEGWAEGLEGAQQGATRVFVLPPDLGYSEQGGNPLASDSLVVVAEVTGVS
ncbi:hypothetical protein BJF85_09350 [Saccharomonospora sp. CUA-673]|uniref:FKBP-type peptidyl-prolyl cis-trans isomerase n=1 Tax=Saccharomonospora sp. CUA-673 TaxID=1904969 RepID=UPI000966EF0D|nr:FKBP-type peptidyl-prolyl cis-trans isomerase [Saccharomonospora sp. CUA-673]OLT38514.1 hypothetical protein BJF85_09350 [Saccharomonospora sp. CUA-673]